MKLFTTLVLALLLSVSFNVKSVFANEVITNLTLAEKAVVVSLIKEDVCRELIQVLELNEMQYIKLKDLNRKYKRETQASQILLGASTAELDAKVQTLINTYSQSICEILTEKQVSSYITSQTNTLAITTK